MSIYDIKAVPGTQYVTAYVPAQAAADVTAYVAAIHLPVRCTVVAAWHVCEEAVTGADTNSRNLNLDQADGTEKANVDYAAGENATAGVRNAMSTITEFNEDEGDCLLLESEKVGTGLAVGAGILIVQYRSR
mgnify:CR=1 FL=1